VGRSLQVRASRNGRARRFLVVATFDRCLFYAVCRFHVWILPTSQSLCLACLVYIIVDVSFSSNQVEIFSGRAFLAVVLD
jgi:hypothetical protein